MGRLIDLSSKRFGRLFVVARVGTVRGEAAWQCWCDCGAESMVTGYNLRNGITQSCGCLHREISADIYAALKKTHGQTGTRTYRSWRAMLDRCTNDQHVHWDRYGGRGITVCARWRTFANFYADMGERPEARSLDRIDPDGHYEPGNCRWATARDQRMNRSKAVIDGR